MNIKNIKLIRLYNIWRRKRRIEKLYPQMIDVGKTIVKITTDKNTYTLTFHGEYDIIDNRPFIYHSDTKVIKYLRNPNFVWIDNEIIVYHLIKSIETKTESYFQQFFSK